MILSADSVTPRSLELSLDMNLKTKNIVDVPEMEQFSKAKFSVGKFKPLHICKVYREAFQFSNCQISSIEKDKELILNFERYFKS